MNWRIPNTEMRRTSRGLGRKFEVGEQSALEQTAAFTLIEVMIASGILFVCLFAILGLLANTLRNARGLQRSPVDAGMLAAELSLTNKLSEGADSGDFGDAYRDYRWRRDIFQAETNGLFAVDFFVFRQGHERTPESHMTVLFFRPDSTLTPGGGVRR